MDNGSRDQIPVSRKFGIGFALGIGIGIAIGVGTDNLPVWIAIGVVFGVAIGVAMDRRSKQKDDTHDIS